MVYYCNLTPDPDAGGFVVTFPDIPGVVTEGDTKDEALFNAWEALNGVLESLVSRGMPLPEGKACSDGDLVPVNVEPHIITAWELRKLRGNLPQSEIAKRLGLTYQAYQRLENPIKGNPTIKTLEKVAKVFGKRLVISMV
jgi:antitoxin HicB